MSRRPCGHPAGTRTLSTWADKFLYLCFSFYLYLCFYLYLYFICICVSIFVCICVSRRRCQKPDTGPHGWTKIGSLNLSFKRCPCNPTRGIGSQLLKNPPNCHFSPFQTKLLPDLRLTVWPRRAVMLPAIYLVKRILFKS